MSQMFERDKFKFATKKIIKLVENKNDINRKKDAISFLNKELRLYNLDIIKLYIHVPDYATRNILLNMAYYIVEDDELLEIVTRRREIPLIKIAKATGEQKSFIEKYKDYLMLYILIIHTDRYREIQNYLCIADGRKQCTDIIAAPKVENKLTGLVLKKNEKYAIVITHTGEIRKIKHQSASTGYEVTGREKKGFVHYSRQIVAFIMTMFIALASVYYVYNKTQTTVLISGTSTFKLEVNRYSKVIDAASKTSKGKGILSSMTYKNQDIEYVLNEITNEMINNNMIPDNSEIGIIVSGERLKNTDLRLMEQTVRDTNSEKKINIKIRINNRGLMK